LAIAAFCPYLLGINNRSDVLNLLNKSILNITAFAIKYSGKVNDL